MEQYEEGGIKYLVLPPTMYKALLSVKDWRDYFNKNVVVLESKPMPINKGDK